MAINGTIYGPNQIQIGIAKETTFGTAAADAASFIQLDCDAVTGIDWGLTQNSDMKNRGGRVKYTDDKYVSQTGGIRGFNLSNITVRQKDLPHLLYGVMQNVSEAATTPFAKTYTWGATTQPDFAGSAGYFATVGVKGPIPGRGMKFTSAIIKELKLTADMTGGDGRLKADASFISGFAGSVTSTYSGSWNVHTNSYYDFNMPSLKQINGVDVVLYSWDATFSNNAERVGANTSGNCETYGIPSYTLTGSWTVKYDTNVGGLLADYIAGTTRKFQLATGTVGNTGYFDMTMNACELTGHDNDYGQPQGQAIVIPWEAKYNGTDSLATITVTDGYDWTW